ncbi:MAG: caspase family protein [Planctomycetota bacterium]|nr:caspase family protein [Planctomycetota bacterium]
MRSASYAMRVVSILFSFFLVFIFGEQLKAQRLVTVVMSDSESSIKECSQNSAFAIRIALEVNIPKENFVLAESRQVNRDSLIQSLQELYVHPDDNLFFYYCGHGYVNKLGQPYLLPGGDPLPLLIKDILVQLKNKGARKTVALFDCCQTFRSSTIVMPNVISDTRQITPIYRSLFFDSPSQIPTCYIGTNRGEYAFASHVPENSLDTEIRNLAPSSLFSASLIGTMKKHANELMTWEQFLPVLQQNVDTQFQRVRRYAPILGENVPPFMANQRTQTVTLYVPIEIK